MKYILAFCLLLLCIFLYDKDKFSAVFFGEDNKNYFVDENSGWPYKSYKKEPGYKYFIKDNKVCKKRSSDIEQNQVQEENVGIEGTNRYNTCTTCDGEGETSPCSVCNMEGYINCQRCSGYGNIDGRTCLNCRGSGIQTCYQCEGNPSHSKCRDCDGTGKTKTVWDKCIDCEGGKNERYKGIKCRRCDGAGGYNMELPSNFHEYDEATGTFYQ